MMKVKPQMRGKTERMSFSRIDEVIDMPNLIEIQKNSYKWFLDEGLKEVFKDIAAIEDYSGNLVLDFVDFRLENNPKYSINECKLRDTTYAAPLRVTARLFNKTTGELKEQEIFMGDFPLMTDSGTFIINGAERVIVSQLVRSPGVFYGESFDKLGKKLQRNAADLNLEDFLEQMQQMKKMGPLSNILGMLPGVGSKLKDVEIDENAFKKPEAIVRSMTPQERRHPDILNASRRKRIAAGAGVTVQDVNALMRQFEQMRQMVKQMMGNKKGAMRRMAAGMNRPPFR